MNLAGRPRDARPRRRTRSASEKGHLPSYNRMLDFNILSVSNNRLASLMDLKNNKLKSGIELCTILKKYSLIFQIEVKVMRPKFSLLTCVLKSIEKK